MEASLYKTFEDKSVECNLCHHRCTIKNGCRGICHVRENQGGKLTSLVYGKIVADHIDPIEKKPMFHLHPGSRSYSIATVGCNFKCMFCQNSSIAQLPAGRGGMIVGENLTPEDIVKRALDANCKTIAYTYTEPTVYFEFAADTAKLAHKKGLLNVFVSNGYMTPEALDTIHPYLDAANIDLKAFNDKFYRKYCGAKLANVMESLKKMKELGIFIEITTLLIPGLNDDAKELENLAGFIRDEIGPETPWHVSRFHPTYRMTNVPPTPLERLLAARKIGTAAGLKYVYVGNVPGGDGENTYCPACNKLLIKRLGFHIDDYRLEDGKCRYCGEKIDGIGM